LEKNELKIEFGILFFNSKSYVVFFLLKKGVFVHDFKLHLLRRCRNYQTIILSSLHALLW